MFGACCSRTRLLKTGWAVLFPLLFVSCGPGRGTVDGKITVDGKPVTGGRVFFRSADGVVKMAYISSQGNYHAIDVPAGTLKVNVTPPTPQELQKARRTGKTKKPFAPEAPEAPELPPGTSSVFIPQKYQVPESSGLTCTVKSGTNTFDIEMTSK